MIFYESYISIPLFGEIFFLNLLLIIWAANLETGVQFIELS